MKTRRNGRARRALAIAAAAVVTGSLVATSAPAGARATRRAAVGFDWIQARTQHKKPPALVNATAAYDAATGQFLMFGGSLGDALTPQDSTWLWNGSNWKELTPLHHPDARVEAAMAFDPLTQQLILFGGGGGEFFGDTWSWTGADWVHLHPATHPSKRVHAMAAADATTGLVLFGGYDGRDVLADTWQWTGTTWHRVDTDAAPPARAGGAFAGDSARHELMLFGGTGAGGDLQSDTWRWTGTEWLDASPAHAPSAREDTAVAFDPAIEAVVLYGGYTTSYLDETWTWDGNDWTRRIAEHSPGRRGGAAMAYDAATQNLVLFGGQEGIFRSGDTWTGPVREDDTAPTITSLAAPQVFDDAFTVEFSEPVAVPCCDAITVTAEGGEPLAVTATCLYTPYPDGRCDTWYLDHTDAVVAGQHYDVGFNLGTALVTDWVDNPLAPTTVSVRAQTSVRDSDSPVRRHWGTVKNPAALGGSYVADRSANATYKFSFVGTSLRWFTITGPDQGDAYVRITNPGGHRVACDVDNYAPTTTIDAPIDFTGLTNGKHTIVISADGDSSGSDSYVAVDGFELPGGVVVPTPKASVDFGRVYRGTDTYSYSTTPGASFSLPFRGSSFTWVAYMGPDAGRARVLVDGAAVAIVDLYAKTSGATGYTFPTTDALHRLDIVVLRTANPKSTDNVVGYQRVDVG